MKQLFAMMWLEPVHCVASIICSVMAALLSLSVYLAVALAITAVASPTPDWRMVGTAALLGAGGMAARHILFVMATGLSHGIAFRAQASLRLIIADRLMQVPLGFLDDQSKGRLRATLVDDVEAVEDGIAHLIPEAGAAIIAPLATLIALLFIDWRLALLTLAPITVGLFLMSVMMAKGGDNTKAYMEAQARMGETISEIADGLPTVRLFNQSGQSTRRASAIFAELSRVSNDWMTKAVQPAANAQILLTSPLVLAAPAGFLMAVHGLITFPALVLSLVLAFGFGDVFGAFHGLGHRLMRLSEVLNRIGHLQHATPLAEPARPQKPDGLTIVADTVSFSYGARKVLDAVSFTLQPGQCLALVGASGSGKSTLAKLIGRFHDVETGAIRLGGVDLRTLDSDVLHRHIAFVFQDVVLFSGSIADNLRLGKPDASDDEVMAAATAAQAHDFIMKLPDGYATMLGERGLSLSGGEKQRLSIARAILKDAPILVLDEATAFADPENEAQIQKAIARLAAGRTLIVIAHRLHTIAGADCILVLDKGRVAESGTFAELTAKGGLFARLWQAQQTVFPSTSTTSEAAS